MSRAATTTGAELAVATLAECGVEASFGVPGVHALPYWEALRENPIRQVGNRTELGAAFAADGYARAAGRPAALFLSTGPGALISLGGVMEAASSHVPLVAMASQVETSMLDANRDALHELPEQSVSFAPIVKSTASVRSVDQIPGLVAAACDEAMRPPRGPAFVEVPVDLLRADASGLFPGSGDERQRVSAQPDPGEAERAARILDGARTPLIWAGGGVISSGASEELRRLAEALDAPVVTTFMGKGSIDPGHSLYAGCTPDEQPFQELVAGSDIVLCVGSRLGEEASSAYRIEVPPERLVILDASPDRVASANAAAGLVADAAAGLEALVARLSPERPSRDGLARAASARDRIEAVLAAQDRAAERGLLRSIRGALPPEAVHAWDMTMLGYWAARDFPAGRAGTFLYPVGSGTLGYAWPAAVGAAVARPDSPSLAIAGDGGFMYSIAELASAKQADLNANLLVVDDGGYGILREYQRDAYDETWGVDLEVPDLEELIGSFGVACRATRPDELEDDVRWAIARPGPAALVLCETLRAPVTMP
ncbi:MAG TPA: thiamine pyrophosphate-binding protein [Solirubrobacterales bacterium]